MLLYKEVGPSRADLNIKLLLEFEVVWREVIDPFISTHPTTSKSFCEGDTLFQELLGPETHTILRNLRSNVVRSWEREKDTGGSIGAILPTDE